MVLKTFKQGRRIVCYIRTNGDKFEACTGKPSDACCLAWQYDTIEEAEITAKEYFYNRTNFLR